MLLALKDVARRLNISYPAARMLVLYDEKLPYFKVGSRGIRVKEEDLENYIAKQGQKGKEEVPGSEARETYEGRGILGKEGRV